MKPKGYNIKGKQLLKTLGKYYLVDIGLRRMLLGSRSFDAGRILENIVYLELLHRQQKVYIGKMDNLEVDFVAIDENNITYYQVAATVRDETTLKRDWHLCSRSMTNILSISLHLMKTLLPITTVSRESMP